MTATGIGETMKRMETLAIVGAGLAGTECASAYVGAGGTADVVLIDSRPEPTELPPLSKTLFAEQLNLVPLQLAGSVRLVDGTVAEVAADGRSLRLADGQRLECDSLVVATGLQARRPQTELPGGPVHTIRTSADAEAIRAAVTPGADIGVLGSGYLALEAARGAADAGHSATVYLRGDRPLIGRHHESIGRALMERHAEAGVQFVLEADPSDYAAHDLWIAAVGGSPLTEWLPESWDRSGSGHLSVTGGMQVTSSRQPVSGVWAIGDLAQLSTGPFAGAGPMESEAAASSQGAWLGSQLAAGAPAESEWIDVPWHWSFQGSERVFAAGRVTDTEAALVSGDTSSGRFQVLHFHEDVLCGAETLNQPPAHNAARKLLARPAADRPTLSDVADVTGITEAAETPPGAAATAFDLRAWERRLRN